MISNYLLYLNALPFDEEIKQLFILIACISVLFIAFIIFIVFKFKSHNKKVTTNINN